MFVLNPSEISTSDTKNCFKRALKGSVGVGRKYRCKEVATGTGLSDDLIYSWTKSESEKHPEPENLYKLLTYCDDDFANQYLAQAGLQAFKIKDTHISKYELTKYLINVVAQIANGDPAEKNQHVNTVTEEALKEAGRAIATFLATNN